MLKGRCARISVRVAALEVRKRLERCLGEGGPGDEVQIVLPLGSYVPVFRFREPPVAQAEAPVGGRRTKLVIATIAIALAIVAAFAWLQRHSSTDTRLFSDFWRPVLVNPTPVIICLQSLPAYTRNEPAGAILPASGRFVEIGDAIGAGHIASVFSRFKKQDQTRIVGDLSFADLRRSPTILVGASSSLAGAFNSRFPFVIEETAGERSIREVGPPHRTWRVSPTFDGVPSEDYAIATRIFDSEPGQVLIIVAGINHYGTKAAAEFFSAAHYLSSALTQLPEGVA